MDFEAFNNLTEEEKKAHFESLTALEKTNSDQSAEINSLKKELDEKNTFIEENKKELAATKELNYSLARKIDTNKEKKSFEETLHEAFSKRGE